MIYLPLREEKIVGERLHPAGEALVQPQVVPATRFHFKEKENDACKRKAKGKCQQKKQ